MVGSLLWREQPFADQASTQGEAQGHKDFADLIAGKLRLAHLEVSDH